MKKYISMLLGSILFICFALPLFAASNTPKAVLNARDAVVRVVVERSDGVYTGTGFGIGNSAETLFVVTNNHVVEDGLIFTIYFGADKSVNATVYRAIPELDIAILKLDSKQKGIKQLALSDIEIGDAVYALGYPGSADELSVMKNSGRDYITITSGILSSLKQSYTKNSNRPIKCLQSDAALSFGNSGGPLINSNGHVVGVNTFGSAEDNNIFFAISYEELVDYFDSNNISYKNKISKAKLPDYVVAIIVIFSTILLLLLGILVFVLLKLKASKASLANTVEEPFTQLSFDTTLPKSVSKNTNEASAWARPIESTAATPYIEPFDISLQASGEFVDKRFVKRAAKKTRMLLAALITVPIILGFAAVFLFHIIQNTEIDKAFDNRDFERTVSLYNAAPWIADKDPDKFNYSWAMYYLESNNLPKALEKFKLTLAYEDSKVYVEKLEKYIPLLQVEPYYPDMYIQTIEKFNELGDFLKSSIRAQALKEELYDWTLSSLVKCSSFGGYENLQPSLEYLNTEIFNLYLTVMNDYVKAYNTGSPTSYRRAMSYAYGALEDDIYINNLLFNSESNFLLIADQHWQSIDGNYYFYFPEELGIYFDCVVPGFSNGNASLYANGLYRNDSLICEVELIDYDTLRVCVPGYSNVYMHRS